MLLIISTLDVVKKLFIESVIIYGKLVPSESFTVVMPVYD